METPATSAIPDSATLVASADLLSTDFGEETVILNLANGKYYGLEGAGVLVWSLLREPVAFGRIREAVTAEYDVEPARCARDLRDLLEQLSAQGLIEVRRSS